MLCDCEIYETCDKCRGTDRDPELWLREQMAKKLLAAVAPPKVGLFNWSGRYPSDKEQ